MSTLEDALAQVGQLEELQAFLPDDSPAAEGAQAILEYLPNWDTLYAEAELLSGGNLSSNDVKVMQALVGHCLMPCGDL